MDEGEPARRDPGLRHPPHRPPRPLRAASPERLVFGVWLAFLAGRYRGLRLLVDWIFPPAESEVPSCLPLLPRTVPGSRGAARSGAGVPLRLGTGAGTPSAKVGWSREHIGWGNLGDLPRHLVGVEKRWGISRGTGMLGMREIEATGQTVSSPFPQTPMTHGPDFSCYFLLF